MSASDDKKVDMQQLISYHQRPDYSQVRSGPGENGAGVELSGAERDEGEKQMKTWFMNVVARSAITAFIIKL
jgi:hypothetical protein